MKMKKLIDRISLEYGIILAVGVGYIDESKELVIVLPFLLININFERKRTLKITRNDKGKN